MESPKKSKEEPKDNKAYHWNEEHLTLTDENDDILAWFDADFVAEMKEKQQERKEESK